MTFPSPAIVPPIVLLEPKTHKPLPMFPKSRVPVGSVPMKLPNIILSVMILTPYSLLPEITLRVSIVVPPIVVPYSALTPSPALPNTRVPVISIPMKFPCTLFPIELVPSIVIPFSPLADIIFRAADTVPPIVLLLP